MHICIHGLAIFTQSDPLQLVNRVVHWYAVYRLMRAVYAYAEPMQQNVLFFLSSVFCVCRGKCKQKQNAQRFSAEAK